MMIEFLETEHTTHLLTKSSTSLRIRSPLADGHLGSPQRRREGRHPRALGGEPRLLVVRGALKGGSSAEGSAATWCGEDATPNGDHGMFWFIFPFNSCFFRYPFFDPHVLGFLSKLLWFHSNLS